MFFNTLCKTAALALTTAPLAFAAVTYEKYVDHALGRRDEFDGVNWGQGTRYGNDCTEEDCWQSGACAFTNYTLPAGIDGSTCISNALWDSAGQCGGCISVTYRGKTLKIMVTNRTGGNATHLDMPPETWSKLTNGMTGGGVDGIEWQFVPCPFETSSSLSLVAHGGSSMYWPALVVEGARRRTASLEYSPDGGSTWVPSERSSTNFFKSSQNFHSNTVDVRLTSHVGTQVVVKNINLVAGSVTNSTENYA